jgi:gliding motility-associated-like protein
MMVINASTNPGPFYQTTVNNLCANTTYELDAWIINLINYTGKKPNIKFEVLDLQGNQLAPPYSTGDIPETENPTWNQYGMLFTLPPNLSSVIIRMTNNGTGGVGNDIALDDITFRACGPSIVPSIDNSKTVVKMCESSNASYNLSAIVSPGYADPVYQWQVKTGPNWTNIAGQVLTQTTVQFTNAIVGTYEYRIIVSERQNAGGNCFIASDPLTVTVTPKNAVNVPSNIPVCLGTTLILTAGGPVGASYSWTGPQGFSQNVKNPTIPNIDYINAGIYQVTVTDGDSCPAVGQTNVQVVPRPTAILNMTEATICEEKKVELIASGGLEYSWTPTLGLSNPKIANPIASPLETTTYTVTVTSGTCSAEAKVKVNVIRSALANAGDDKIKFTDHSVILNGNIAGTNVSYFWTPSDYLDDPTKLNPTANPPYDITYTLNAVSKDGCFSRNDDVFVKVYQTIDIPNTFTPNGDGINDTWRIPVITTFPNPKLQVVNRFGQVVFLGYKDPKWDGKSKGKDVPAGIYYYTLYINNEFKIYSGWLLITR